MKLAITQIVLGVLVILIDGLTVGAAFSTHFGYLRPDGGFEEQLWASSVSVTRWAALAVIPLGVLIVGCGIVQLRRARRK